MAPPLHAGVRAIIVPAARRRWYRGAVLSAAESSSSASSRSAGRSSRRQCLHYSLPVPAQRRAFATSEHADEADGKKRPTRQPSKAQHMEEPKPFGSDKPTELKRRRRRPHRKSDTLVAMIEELKKKTGEFQDIDTGSGGGGGGGGFVDDGDYLDIDDEYLEKITGKKNLEELTGRKL